VPRDIEGEGAELDDAYLYTVDDLQHIVEQNLASRQDAAKEAQLMIDQQAMEFMQWRQAQTSIDVLRDFRQHSESQRDTLLAKALKQLAEGKEAQQVLNELANKLTNTLIHSPTKALKKAAQEQDAQGLAFLKASLGLASDNETN
jgi:glutamyl-tRNA reductase